MNKIFILAVILVLFPTLSEAQEKTYIPDNNFEQFLIKSGYDKELDNYVWTSNIEGITLLSIDERNIASLTGIGGFKSLERLYCFKNALTELDVSSNKKLIYLFCDSNRITSLKVNNPELITLSCYDNQLSSLDLAGCKALKYLFCQNNKLTALDVSSNPAMLTIYCQNNLLTRLNVNTGMLQELYCKGNQLTSLNLKSNRYLEKLECTDNQLTSLDVSSNRKLKRFMCNNNRLTSMNVSANPALELFYCPGNQLTSLNLKNGNNHKMNGGLPGVIGMMATNNPHLSCIQVDDPVAAKGYLWMKDAAATYSADCGYEDLTKSMTFVPDDHFEQALIDFGFDHGALNDSVSKAAIDTILTLNVSNKEIKDLTGINDFTALKELDCSNNKLTAFKGENLLPLTYLYCFNNSISSLTLGVNSSLTVLNCSFNNLPVFQVSPFTPLKSAPVDGNQTDGLIISPDAKLKELNCQGNQIIHLDVSNMKVLEKLDCKNNKLASLNLKNGQNSALTVMNATGNSGLTCIQVDNPVVATTYTGWSKDAGASYSADCGYILPIMMSYIPDNHFEQALIDLGYDSGVLNDSIPIAAIDTIKSLNISGKQIFDLTGISQFKSLKSFNCSNNQLTFAQLEPVFGLSNFGNFSSNFIYFPQAKAGVAKDTSVVQGSDIRLTIAGYTPGKNDVYSWSKTSPQKSANSDPSLVIQNVSLSDSGQYVCTITNTLVTGLTLETEPITLKVTVPVSTSVFSQAFDLGIFPNPASCYFTVECNGFRESGWYLEIIDATGKCVSTEQIKPGNVEIKVDISKLHTGLYFCKTGFGGQFLIRKINVIR